MRYRRGMGPIFKMIDNIILKARHANSIEERDQLMSEAYSIIEQIKREV